MALKIAVFGSFIADVTARANKIPAPGENVIGDSLTVGPGGKGSNQAVAAYKAGSDLRFVGKIGKDSFGSVARDYYASIGMDTSGLMEDDSLGTGSALISVCSETGQNSIIIVLGANGSYTKEEEERAKELISGRDILLMQMETPAAVNLRMLKFAKAQGMRTIFNAAPAQSLDEEFYRYIDIITPNEFEAQALTGLPVDPQDDEKVRAAGKALLNKGVKQVIITLGERGVYAAQGSEERFVPTLKGIKAVDTTGAGDAFNGGFAAALSFGMDFFAAVDYAQVVAGLCVTKEGSARSMPDKQEIEAALKAVK